MPDVENLQRWYYGVATIAACTTILSIASGAVWFIVRRQRERIHALHGRIDEIKRDMVTTATMRETVREIIDRSDRRWSEHQAETMEWRAEHEKLSAAVIERLEDGIESLRDVHKDFMIEMRELRNTIIEVLKKR